MSVVCATCKTENRDTAMFCRGCAGRLPAFAPTGPSALEAMDAARARDKKASLANAPSGARERLPLETRTFWLRAATVVVAFTIAFVGWYAYVTRKSSAPSGPDAAVAHAKPGTADAAKARSKASTAEGSGGATASAANPSTTASAAPNALGSAPASSSEASTIAQPPIVTSSSSPSPFAPAATATPGQVPLDSSLAPGEVNVDPRSTSKSRPTERDLAALPQRSLRERELDRDRERERLIRQAPVAEAQTEVQTQRVAAADPRHGCEGMNFFFAARCEAANCDKPIYSRHPRCDEVRADRRRDEARRNPTMGF